MSNVTIRKEGRFEIRFYSEGKYRSFYGKTAEEAVYKYEMYREGLVSHVSVYDMTVKDLCEEWLAVSAVRHKETTAANYRMKLETHIYPAFGDIALCKLCAGDIHAFIRDKKELAPSYLYDILVLLKTVLKYAHNTYGTENIMKNVVMPKKPKKELVLPSHREQKKLCSCLFASGDRTALGILIAAFMGLRIGEICGLKWEDVDLEKGMLYIRRTVQRIQCRGGSAKTVLYTGLPKSRLSLRKIPVPRILEPLFSKFAGAKEEFILTGTETCMEPRTLDNHFKKTLAKAGLERIKFHTLRHMFATNFIESCGDAKALSEILGHSTVEITLKLYVHSSDEWKRDCINRTDTAA